jgi:hypothetical protein
MADAGDSKSPALHGHVGSTPTSGTRFRPEPSRNSRDRLSSPTKVECSAESAHWLQEQAESEASNPACDMERTDRS